MDKPMTAAENAEYQADCASMFPEAMVPPADPRWSRSFGPTPRAAIRPAKARRPLITSTPWGTR